MAAKSFSISFDQAADTPLKIVPKNTWVKINNFKNPCRLLEISPQSLTLDVTSEPETLSLHAGQNIKIQILNIAEEKEKPFELRVTIFYINDSECLCQIPLFVNNEQILVDKIILEIQKNEIGIKNNSVRKNKNADHDENAAPLIPTDENIAPILNNLIAMLPNETKGTEEHVTASQITNIPKSTYNYQQVDLSKLFDDAHTISDEQEEQEEYKEEEEETSPASRLLSNFHPLALLRYSIINKFVLDNLPDAYPEETKKIEEAQLDPNEVNINEFMGDGTDHAMGNTKSDRKKRKIKELKRRVQPGADDVANFLPSNLIEEMSMPDFMANIDKTNEYDYNLSNQTKQPVDKDAAFDNYYEFSSELPPELVFELMQKAKKRKEEYEGLEAKYKTDEYGYTMVDEENYEAVDDDEYVLGKFDDLLKNKRRIKLNLNDDADYVAMTDEEKDEAFIEKLNSQTSEQKGDEKPKFNFKLDI